MVKCVHLHMYGFHHSRFIVGLSLAECRRQLPAAAVDVRGALELTKMQEPLLIYDSVGSDEPYFQLVEQFYSGVEADPLLRPLYPSDLTESKKHLALFLIQRTGGHMTYSMERGHPRMRARHMPFAIGWPERDAWIVHMTKALESVPEFAAHKGALLAFFQEFATFLINQPR